MSHQLKSLQRRERRLQSRLQRNQQRQLAILRNPQYREHLLSPVRNSLPPVDQRPPFDLNRLL